ncbi:MAG: glycosyltransferase [Muribaculaceae bacterium]|nr:glycosyltransferase [Muribaculaceae bacterium]
MKILHVITSLHTGGAERLMVDLLPRLKERGIAVDLLLFNGTRTPFREDIEARGIKVIDFGQKNNVYNPLNILRLRKYVSNYDIIHTHNYSPQIFTIFSLFGKKTKLVTTEHSGSNRRRAHRWFAHIDRWMYNKYDRVICIADKTLNNIIDFIGKGNDNMTVINNGIDTSRFINATPSDALETIAPGSKKVIMVAGFRWEKDQDTLIASLEHLPDTFHLFLVGDGIRRNELEKVASDKRLSERIHFLGVRTDIPQLLRAADYIVMSSHFEGLSLSSVEGLCSGKPFLASDVDGLREITHGAGILFPHSDAQTLADIILNLENNPKQYNEVSQKCVDRGRQYDISTMTDKYIRCYQEILDSNRKA